MSANPRRDGAQSQPEPPAPYRPTLFDRLGPEAAVAIRARMYGFATFALSLPLGATVARKINPQMSSFSAALFALVLSVAVAAFAIRIGSATFNAAGNLFGRFLMGGDNTPYREQYSREQALVMRGEVDEALRSFEAIIADKPEAIDPRFKAAELYVKEKGDHRRAAELFREVQRIEPLTPGEDIYATNRLVDLYTGPLADPGRALVELRRLIERHPDSRAATHARTALAALKAHVRSAS